MGDEISRFRALAAHPSNAENPLAQPLARMIERYERTERRLERLARMGDRFMVELKQTTEALKAAHADATDGELDAADYVRSMLPPPADGRAKARWCFLPAREFAGGAIGYRWLPGGRTFAFFVIDAAGRGVRTSLLALSILNALHGRALATSQVDAPDAVLKALHAMFPAVDHNGLTTAIAYFVLDCETRELRYAGTKGVGALLAAAPNVNASEASDGRASGPRSFTFDAPPIGDPAAGPIAVSTLKLEGPAKILLYTQGAARVPVAGADVPIEAWIASIDGADRDVPSLVEDAMRIQREGHEPGEDCVVLEVDFPANMSAPRSLPPRAAGGPRTPWSTMDDAQELAWVEALVSRKQAPEPGDVEQLARRYVHLMRRLAKLTRISDAYQKELRLSNRQLEELNGDLDAFASRAAHDLKAPLTNIVELASLIADPHVTSDLAGAQWLSGDIARSSRKMVEIIDSLMMLARIRHQDIASNRVNMAKVFPEVAIRLRSLLTLNHAKLKTPPRWPVVLGYAPWIEAVWTNYVSNALKYGGRPPVVEVGADPEQSGLVRLWVKDNGPGLDEEQRGRLFQPFTRLHPARGEGHGLGLTIIRRIVERLGGTVGVDSKVGEGSTFWFTLPVAPELRPDGDGPQSILVRRPSVSQARAVYSGATDAEMGKRHPLRVLIADDNAVNRKVAKLMLARLGYEAEVVVGGREALEETAARPYDVVLMDVNMPGMDGLEATRAIRARDRAVERPRVVGLTGATYDDERAKCVEAGMDDFLSKPVSLEELAAVLAGTARRGEGSSSSPPGPPTPRIA